MKTSFLFSRYLVFAVSVIFLHGCTRAANSENAKIQIKLPTESRISKVQTMNQGEEVSDPKSLLEINCYAVFVGGPDTEMRKNKCDIGAPRVNQTAPVPTEQIKFGDWIGGVQAGQTLSLDIPSGNDRVIHLVGMKVTSSEFCHDFKTTGIPSETQASSPFLLGSVGRLNLKGGETVEVPIIMNFDSQKSIVGCEGPDAPHGNHRDSDGGDGGGNNNGPYLRFEGLGNYNSVLNRDLATVGECYPVRAGVFSGQGSSYINPAGTDLHIDVSNITLGGFYSNSSCSTSITDVVIEANFNRSQSIYYFKPTTLGFNQGIAGLSISGATEPIALGQQPFDIGLRKVMIIGPRKAILNQCYQYSLQTHRFEGGIVNVGITPLNGSATDNANFYLRQNNDCATGVSPSISPYQNNTSVFLKLMSPMPVAMRSHLTFPGYEVENFTVQNAMGGDYEDSLEVSIPNNTIIRGECTMGSIRIVNHDGGILINKRPLEIGLAVPVGAGVFYYNQNCTGSEVNKLNFPAGQSEVNFWFQAHSIPESMLSSGLLLFSIDAGNLRLFGQPYNGTTVVGVNVVNPLFSGYAILDPPMFNGAETVGNHEFNQDAGVPKTIRHIPLHTNYEELVDVECSLDNSSFTSCIAAKLDRGAQPYKFRWSASDAQNNITNYLRFQFEGGYFRTVRINGMAMFGPNFKVMDCDTIYTATGPQSYSAFASWGPIICLPEGATYLKVSSSALTMDDSHRGIIGHSSGTSIFDSNGQPGNLIEAAGPMSGGDFVLANVRLQNTASSSSGFSIGSLTAGFPRQMLISKVSLNPAGPSTNGVSLNAKNNLNVDVTIRNNIFNVSGGSAVGVAMDSSSYVTVVDSEFSVTGAGGYGVKVQNSSGSGGQTINVLHTYISVGNATAIKVYNTNTVAADLTIKNSRFQRVGTGNSGVPIVHLEGRIDGGYFENNLIFTMGQQNMALVNLVGAPSTINFDAFMSNAFIQSQAGSPALKISNLVNFNDFARNSFAYNNVAVTSSAAIQVESNGVLNVNSTALPADSGSTVCGVSGNVFNNRIFVAGGGTVGGGFSIAAMPYLTNNMMTTSGRCKGP